ncbi:hypothetical protein BDV98DRAFT_265720 [Pterulicium gracile]|uniref:Uncharacterized protein n=1 Tax=Pterulicium gracile TaxID=1884261 RepID=A0A5C3Q818_9AGAR|nr:hypothetical protein BDV98DRAFT_265720 [Pterula gracilis]
MVGAFSNAMTGCNVSLQIGAPLIGGIGASYSYYWSNVHPPAQRAYPSTMHDSRIQAEPQLASTDTSNIASDRDAPGSRNQCIFIRGWSIKLSQSLICKKLKDRVSLLEEKDASSIIRAGLE